MFIASALSNQYNSNWHYDQTNKAIITFLLNGRQTSKKLHRVGWPFFHWSKNLVDTVSKTSRHGNIGLQVARWQAHTTFHQRVVLDMARNFDAQRETVSLITLFLPLVVVSFVLYYTHKGYCFTSQVEYWFPNPEKQVALLCILVTSTCKCTCNPLLVVVKTSPSW